ncbi:MAG TPA: PilC/PilY family type IV pilus protein [Candidatus Binatia bacterium]
MKRIIAIIEIFTIAFWHGWALRPLFADDNDIFESNVNPNVMLLIDSSQSMLDAVYATPYNSGQTYNTPLTYTTGTVYRKFTTSSSCKPAATPCYKSYASSISAVNSSAAQTALSSSGYWSGTISGTSVSLFYGNYLNWSLCSSCTIQEAKISIAKRVLTKLVNSVDDVRFGAMYFKNLGGQVLQPIRDMTSSNRTTLVNSINSMALTSVGTPLGEQLRDGGNYYKGNISGYASPIQYSCQPNFIIVISDGLYTGTVDPRTEGTNRYTQDHSSTYSGKQNVIVHAVGFGVDPSEATAANDVLQTMATNGGGKFFSTQNEAQLELALQDAISQIIAGSFSFSAPVVPTTATGSGTRAYLASFETDPTRPFWRGHLNAYTRDSNGLIQVDANGNPLSSTMVWDAGQSLSTKAASSRTIYTYLSSALQSFTTSNSNITISALAASSTAEHDNIINFTRGTDSYDEDADGNTSEQRAWKLGDIFHSTPVLVAPPFLPSTDSTYNSFKSTNASRTTILLVGANDGMLHAFRESDGAELWAFIPPDQLDDLKGLTLSSADHDYLVDATPVVADVKIGSNWKTVVVFGERRGGRSYYALDITNTSSPQYLWSFTDSKMGETWSEPAIGKVQISGASDKYVAFIGGGYDTTSNNSTGKAFFAIDMSNGAKLWEYYKPASPTGDKQYMNFSLAATPSAVDLNNDGYIDKVYIGDVGGQLWKFDVSAAATLSGGLVTNWTGKRLFAAASSQANPPAAGEYYPAQAIYGSTSVAKDANGNVWVYIGTGDLNHPENTSTNRFYAIKDNTSMTNGSTLTESSLTNVTGGTGSVSQGWYVALNSNEKVFSSAEVFDSRVYFTSYTPTNTVSCGSVGGNSKLYAVNLTTGDAALDLGSGSVLAAGQSALSFAKNIGSGISSGPGIAVKQSGTAGTPYLITGTSNQQITNTKLPDITLRRFVGWREVF